MLALLFFSTLQAQILQPADYNFYDSSDKTTLFYEGFDDLTISKWVDTCVCKDISAVNVSGYFYFINDQTQRNYYRSAATKAPIAENTDFEIEFRAKIPSESPDDYGVVFWGKDTASWRYYRCFFRNGSNNAISHVNATKDDFYYHFTLPRSFDRQGFNTYTIRKTGNRYFVFVNGTYTESLPFNKLYGPKFGIGGSSNNVVIFDYLKVSRLETNKPYKTKPGYIAGERELDYLVKNKLACPIEAIEKCMQGSFIAKFLINTNGGIDSIISYSGFAPLNTVVLKAFLETNNKWYPAIKDGKPVQDWVAKIITFRTCSRNRFAQSDYYYKKAMDAYKANKEDEAIENFKIAAGMDYTDVNSLYNIAGIYLNEGKENEARYWLQRINELRDFDIPDLEGIDAKITALGADELIKRYCSQ